MSETATTTRSTATLEIAEPTTEMDIETQPELVEPNGQRRKRVFSGIQPSGTLTIGNYLGAVRRWVVQQHERQSIHAIVDLHAMTVPFEADDLRRRTLDLAAG